MSGQAGVGKSTLVRQLETAAGAAGAGAVYADESTADPVEPMEAIALQLSRQGLPLKTFDRRLAEYRRLRHEAAAGLAQSTAEPEGPGGPDGGGAAPGAPRTAGFGSTGVHRGWAEGLAFLVHCAREHLAGAEVTGIADAALTRFLDRAPLRHKLSEVLDDLKDQAGLFGFPEAPLLPRRARLEAALAEARHRATRRPTG